MASLEWTMISNIAEIESLQTCSSVARRGEELKMKQAAELQSHKNNIRRVEEKQANIVHDMLAILARKTHLIKVRRHYGMGVHL